MARATGPVCTWRGPLPCATPGAVAIGASHVRSQVRNNPRVALGYVDRAVVPAAAAGGSAAVPGSEPVTAVLYLVRAPVKVAVDRAGTAERPHGRACLLWRLLAPEAQINVLPLTGRLRFVGRGHERGRPPVPRGKYATACLYLAAVIHRA